VANLTAIWCLVTVLGVRGKLLLRLVLIMLCDAGYIMDRRVGNTKKMGALFGILAAIGVWVPQPGSFSFALLTSVNWLREKVTGERISPASYSLLYSSVVKALQGAATSSW